MQSVIWFYVDADFHFRFHIKTCLQFYVNARSHMIDKLSSGHMSTPVSASGFIWKPPVTFMWTPFFDLITYWRPESWFSWTTAFKLKHSLEKVSKNILHGGSKNIFMMQSAFTRNCTPVFKNNLTWKPASKMWWTSRPSRRFSHTLCHCLETCVQINIYQRLNLATHEKDNPCFSLSIRSNGT